MEQDQPEYAVPERTPDGAEYAVPPRSPDQIEHGAFTDALAQTAQDLKQVGLSALGGAAGMALYDKFKDPPPCRRGAGVMPASCWRFVERPRQDSNLGPAD